jgi:glycosyltransferase involved in cell wall biosynthesis
LSRVRVLQVHTRYQREAGEDVVVRLEAALLRRRGHEVVEYHAANPSGAAAVAALALAPANPLAVRAARRAAEETRPDLVHVHNTWFALSPAVLGAFRQLGLPVVMTLHNYRVTCARGTLFRDGAPCEACLGSHPWHAVRYGCWRGPVLSVPAAATVALHRWLDTYARTVDVFMALNDAMRTHLVRAGLPADRLRVKPNFVPDPGARAIPPGSARTVVQVGRLTPEKGVGTLLAAWRLLGETPLELVIIGDGPLRGQLEREAPPGVRFTGWIGPDQVREALLNARALALPIVSYEGLPLTGLEALAAGLPVLASRIDALPGLLGPLGPGWLVEPGEPAAWADALRALEDTSRIDRAGARARTLYERDYSEAAVGATLLDAYEAALARRA